MKIKICGIASERDAESAVAEGADLLGFVFMRGPRRIEPARVKQIVDTLPSHVGSVGVFRNQPLEEVRSTLAQSGVGMAQLNGAEIITRPNFFAHVAQPALTSPFPPGSER